MEQRCSAAISIIIHSSLFVLFLTGCSGRGDIEFVSLNMTEIDPPQAQAWSFKAPECYWWIDAEGELNIAMRHRQRNPLLGKIAQVDLVMSFVFDSPPAGRARNYKISNQDVRTLYASPLAMQRFSAAGGIVGVTIGQDGILRGSYRLWMMPLMDASLFSFMPQRPGSVLCFGSFEAVRDEMRGLPLRVFSESNGYARPKRGPTSRPVLHPAKLATLSD